jgi:hypothetical protein
LEAEIQIRMEHYIVSESESGRWNGGKENARLVGGEMLRNKTERKPFRRDAKAPFIPISEGRERENQKTNANLT